MSGDKMWTFERFTLSMPARCGGIAHYGDCTSDVTEWASRISRPVDATPEALRAELREYGAWNDDQLADDTTNWERIVWIAAGNIRDDDATDDE